MQVVLRVRNGPRAGQIFQLRTGQRATFGRSDWADFPLPEVDLADEQFALESTPHAVTLRHVGGDDHETAVNGSPIDETSLATGDVVSAGGLELAVQIVGEAVEPPPAIVATPAASQDATESKAAAGPRGPVELAGLLELSDAAKATAGDVSEPIEYLDALVAGEQFQDAITLAAFLLGGPEAVAWGAECLRAVIGDSIAPADAAALTAAETWAGDPTDENRRAARDVAEATDYSTGATWIALAAFWSGGSLADADLPEVAPDEALFTRGLTGGLTMTATNDPQPVERYRAFLESARTRLAGSS